MSHAPERPAPPAASSQLEMPIFPLPDVVLFPGVVLPLHVFEERYRRLVADALAGDRRFGMALLRPGWEADYAGRPPVHPLVGYGRIESAQALADGRYLLRLRGEGKGRIQSEMAGGPYRRVILTVETDAPAGPELAGWIERVRAARAALGPAANPDLDTAGGIELVHLAASELALAPEERLALLALTDPVERARRVCVRLDELCARAAALAAHRWRRGDPELN